MTKTQAQKYYNYKRTTYEWNENSIHPPKVSINPCIFVTCFLNKPRELFHESEFFQIQFLLPFNKRQSVQGRRIHTLGQNILRQINGRNSHQCTTNLIGLNKYIFISGINTFVFHFLIFPVKRMLLVTLRSVPSR